MPAAARDGAATIADPGDEAIGQISRNERHVGRQEEDETGMGLGTEAKRRSETRQRTRDVRAVEKDRDIDATDRRRIAHGYCDHAGPGERLI